MSLSKQAKDKLKSLGLNVTELESAIKSEDEIDFKIPDLKVYSEDELAQRDENVKKEGFKEGKDVGIKTATKAIADKFNLEGDFTKPNSVAEKIAETMSAGDPALKDQISKLQQQTQTYEAKIAETQKNFDNALFERDLIEMFPPNRDPRITTSEYLAIIKTGLQFEKTDNGMVVKKGNEILRDQKTQNPLPVNDAISSLFTERNWIKEETPNPPPGGRGGGDNSGQGGSKPNKYSVLKEQHLAQGKPLDSDFSKYAASVAGEIMKAGGVFEWD